MFSASGFLVLASSLYYAQQKEKKFIFYLFYLKINIIICLLEKNKIKSRIIHAYINIYFYLN